MDLMEYFANSTKVNNSVVWDFHRYAHITYPYLTFTVLAAIAGTSGDILVIAAILINKVWFENV